MPRQGIKNLEGLLGVEHCPPLRGEKRRGMYREVLAPHSVTDLCPGEKKTKSSTLYC